ncbi:hypothetical protein SDC9_199118 [bioreactor metagenome]|uniref:Uncharacterized protein n=1 Tax=bioreactor metagenome TaxID=1076179 RepID=A0A645IKV1_9ZZZZ
MLRYHVAAEVNATTDIELIGIRIAAKSGETYPATAKLTPITL